MKQIYVLMISLFILTSMVSCGVKNDPVEISKVAIECFQKGKFAKVKEMSTEKFHVILSMWEDLYASGAEGRGAPEYMKEVMESEYTFTEQELIGDESAKVCFKRKGKDGGGSTSTFTLEKKDGQWYITEFYR